MNPKAALVIAWCVLASTFALGQAPAGSQRPAETTAPNIAGVVAAGTKVELIREGLGSTQGMAAAPDGSLLFTDRAASRIMKMDPAGNVSTYIENTGEANSFTIDAKGRVVAVQFVPSQVSVLAPTRSVLATDFKGRPFTRANDIAADRKGGVYFTDDLGKPPEIKPAVFYINPAGQLSMITDQISRPNGVVLSPDEKALYIPDSNGEHVYVMDVQPDGSARNLRPFATLVGGRKTETGMASGADGLTIDAAGRLYVTSAAGVQVISPEGRHLGTIPLSVASQQIAFAGSDKKTLYVSAAGGRVLFRIPMLAEGFKGRAK